jgi:hypothetical protein
MLRHLHLPRARVEARSTRTITLANAKQRSFSNGVLEFLTSYPESTPQRPSWILQSRLTLQRSWHFYGVAHQRGDGVSCSYFSDTWYRPSLTQRYGVIYFDIWKLERPYWNSCRRPAGPSALVIIVANKLYGCGRIRRVLCFHQET